MPLVNEPVIGLPDKNLFKAVKPTADGALAKYVTNQTCPEILQQLFGVQAPSNFPRNDLIATFLTGIATLNQQAPITPSEMIRLNTGVNPTPQALQKTLGVVADDLAGFPNGRLSGDDVVDIVLRVAMGACVTWCRLSDRQRRSACARRQTLRTVLLRAPTVLRAMRSTP